MYLSVWNHVLNIVTVLAILTNCSLMALTSFQFSWLADHIGTLGVFALSIGWEHLMLLVKYIMQLTVPTMPASVEMRHKRRSTSKNARGTIHCEQRKKGEVVA